MGIACAHSNKDTSKLRHAHLIYSDPVCTQASVQLYANVRTVVRKRPYNYAPGYVQMYVAWRIIRISKCLVGQNVGLDVAIKELLAELDVKGLKLTTYKGLLL